MTAIGAHFTVVPIGMAVAYQPDGAPPINNSTPAEDPHAELERRFIDELLGSRGHTRHSVRDLPDPEAARLLRAASEHASLRLAEIESKAHYVDEIHRPS